MKWIPTLLGCLCLGIASRLPAQDEIEPVYGYLLEQVTAPSSNGALSFPPATRVAIMEEKPNHKTAIKISGHEFEIATALITRDASVAQALLTKMAEQKRGIVRSNVKPGKGAGGLGGDATPGGAVADSRLLALQRQELQVQNQMDRTRAAMQNTPHKPKPWSQMDYANNAQHDKLKAQLENLRQQHEKIQEQERLLKREEKKEASAPPKMGRTALPE